MILAQKGTYYDPVTFQKSALEWRMVKNGERGHGKWQWWRFWTWSSWCVPLSCLKPTILVLKFSKLAHPKFETFRFPFSSSRRFSFFFFCFFGFKSLIEVLSLKRSSIMTPKQRTVRPEIVTCLAEVRVLSIIKPNPQEFINLTNTWTGSPTIQINSYLPASFGSPSLNSALCNFVPYQYGFIVQDLSIMNR